MFFIISHILSSDIIPVPNVFTQIDNGSFIPIAYDTSISHFLARLFATIFFAICLNIYVADLSTLLASFPENAPPPCLLYPPYVSTIIFLPVSPVSPRGPPITNLPVGLIYIFVFSSIMQLGTIALITFSVTSFLNVSISTSALCCVDIKIVSILLGLLFSYSTVTCVFPSGLKYGIVFSFLTFVNLFASSCAMYIAYGM